MNVSKIFLKHYINVGWTSEKTDEFIVWQERAISKPTEDELNQLYDDVLVDKMREKRTNF
jgi:hypothetical protein